MTIKFEVGIGFSTCGIWRVIEDYPQKNINSRTGVSPDFTFESSCADKTWGIQVKAVANRAYRRAARERRYLFA